jgi:hypothetical protein
LDLLVLRLQSLLITNNTTRTYKPYSAITDLHNFQFTAAHTLGFSVFCSRRNSSQQWLCLCKVFPVRFLATDFNTGTITSSHMKFSCHFFFDLLGMPTQFSDSNSPVSVEHGTNLYTLISSIYFHWSPLSVSWQRMYNTGTIKVSLIQYTLPISLHYSTQKIFTSHVKSSQADFLFFFNYELPDF